MASKKSYKCKVAIQMGNGRNFKRNQVISSANVKKETIKGLLDKGYIEEYKPLAEAPQEKVEITKKEVNNANVTPGVTDPDDDAKDDDTTPVAPSPNDLIE